MLNLVNFFIWEMRIIIAHTLQCYWEDWMKESIQSTQSLQGTLLGAVLRARIYRPENFVWLSRWQLGLHRSSRKHFLFLWRLVPLRFQFQKEMKLFMILEHTSVKLEISSELTRFHTALLQQCSPIFLCVCSSLLAVHRKERCQSPLKLCWSPQREASYTWT